MENNSINIENEDNQQINDQSSEKTNKPEIINVIQYYQKGNFGPAIICLKNNWLKPDFYDDNGYNILHNATCYNEQSIVRLLVEYFGISPDLVAKNGQNNAMIAANFGYLELLKYFIDKNVDIEIKDNANFNPLLYSCKVQIFIRIFINFQSNYITCFFYLLFKGSSLAIIDQNGCGVVHWAAYRDNIYLLRIFKTLGLDLNLKDNNGFTPFQRALQNESYDSIEFFCEEAEIQILPEIVNLNKIESPYIKNYLTKKIQEKQNNIPLFDLEQQFWKFYLQRPKFNISIFYVISILLMYYNFFTGIYSLEPTQRGSYFWTDIFFNLTTLYFMAFAILFIWCIRSAQQRKSKQQTQKYQKLKEENLNLNQNMNKNNDIMQGFTNINIEEMKYLNFTNLNNLIGQIGKKNVTQQIDNELFSLSETQSYTFLHYLAYLIESHQFIIAQSVDYSRYCPTCLKYKQPKTKHCKYCNICIPNFNHHSLIFNKCINNQNHIAYMTLLLIQELWLILSLYLQISALNNQRTSWNILIFIEIAYLNLTSFSMINCIIYALNGITLFYNSLFLIIEISGICLNQTLNEIFNRTRYRYLYEPYIDKKGKVWNRYVNKTSLGFFNNIKLYFKRALTF